jgi:serine/threonine protein kinase
LTRQKLKLKVFSLFNLEIIKSISPNEIIILDKQPSGGSTQISTDCKILYKISANKKGNSDTIISLEPQITMFNENDNPFQGLLNSKGFIFEKESGQGSFGKVLIVRRKTSNEKFAMKIIKETYKVTTQKYFKREYDALYKLTQEGCDNIVKLYDKGSHVTNGDTYFYLLMEVIEGDTLTKAARLNDKNKMLSELEIYYFLSQIIKGLEGMHKNDITHRDLKPDNIMVTNKDKVLKIIDFTAALKDGESSDITNIGTPNYQAPEIKFGKTSDITKSDLYSCGIILFELAFKIKPYNDAAQFYKIEAYETVIYQMYYNTNRKISKGLKELIDGLVTINVSKRYGIEEIKGSQWYNDNRGIVKDLIKKYGVTSLYDNILKY